MPVGRRPVTALMHFISQGTSSACSAYYRSKSPARRTGMRCRATSSLLTGLGISEMFLRSFVDDLGGSALGQRFDTQFIPPFARKIGDHQIIGHADMIL